MSSGLQSAFFQLSSGLTDRIPRTGARLLDAVLVPVFASREMERRLAAREAKALVRLGAVHRVLVLADIHLGDAVMHQSIVTALRDFFPRAEIDYAVSRAAVCLVAGNPEITEVRPVYTSGPLPGRSDLEEVSRLCNEGGYDLAVNACPFFVRGNPIPGHLPLLDFTGQAPQLLRNEQTPGEPNHFLYQAHVFLHRILRQRFRPVREKPLRGVHLTLTERARREAAACLAHATGGFEGPVVLVNPDTGSPFTRPPFELLAQLIGDLARSPIRVLVGEGHTDHGVGRRLIARLPRRAARRVFLVPASLRADAHAALTDLVDAFISGDTGPLHWAAARKRSAPGTAPCRNQTFVVSLFGATPARMSGYDSVLPGFLPAWQDCPSATYVSEPPCRNITCLNKLQKTCRVARCFEGLGAGPITESVMSYLGETAARKSGLAPVMAADAGV